MHSLVACFLQNFSISDADILLPGLNVPDRRSVRSLEAYSALMNEATDVLLFKLEAAAKENRVVDLYTLIGSMTLQVVGTTAFGCVAFAPSF